MMKKISIVTGSRAEYGLLYWLMKAIQNDPELELQTVVTGMHLSAKYGNTYQQIIDDGFTINKKIDIKISSDNSLGVCKSIGIGIEAFSEVFVDLEPDICIILGDRYEILSVAIAALVSNIPVAHIHGGELTEGAFDDAIRHSITKMSHLHFVATDSYLKRVIQLGENPSRVFNVGGLGIENINKLKLLSREDFQKKINFNLAKKNILVTYHPATLEDLSYKIIFKELLDVLHTLKDTKVIFTAANSDPGGMQINHMIEKFIAKNDNAIFIKSMGQILYLSALKFVDAVIGNSSSGICEAPSFRIASVNIGSRQKGREMASSVINCMPNKKSIETAIKKVYDSRFQTLLKSAVNPYDSGNTSEKIVSIIKSTDLTRITEKKFHDLS